MARSSSIDRLPLETRERICQMRRSGSTIAGIRQYLLDLGISIPSSTLARHTRQIDSLASAFQDHQDIAMALLERLDADPETTTATRRMNSALANSLMFKLLMAQQGDTAPPLSPREAKILIEAHAKLVASDRILAETIGQARREWQAEQRRKLDTLESDVDTGRRPLTLEAVRSIFTDVYGVSESP